MTLANTTPEERAAFFEEFASGLAFNMEQSFGAVAKLTGGLTIQHAISGAIGMMVFGLVLAEKYPDIAAVLREASREHEVADGIEVTTEIAVDAMVAS